MSKFYSIKEETLQEIANTIRMETGKTGKLNPLDIPKEIRALTAEAENSIPDDGKTRIFIHLEEGRTSPMLCCCPNGTVSIDWGDGTTPDVLTGASTTSIRFTPKHNYNFPGDYIITLTIDGEVGFAGTATYGGRILSAETSVGILNTVYSYTVKKIILGDNVNLSDSINGFYNLSGLQSVTISNVSNSSIGLLCFSYDYALAKVTILDGINLIQSNAFSGCYGVGIYDFSKRTSIPALESTNVFKNIPGDCKIYVPEHLYNEWLNATNWSVYAGQIYIAPKEEEA